MTPELESAFILSALPGVTPAVLTDAYRRWQSFSACLEAAPADLEPGLAQPLRYYRKNTARCHRTASEAMAALADRDIDALCLADSRYPLLLREIPRPPVLLYFRGDADVLALPQVAIVGSRQAGTAAVASARRFGDYLAASGFAITSGMALGIDGAAHRGALDAGGRTVAVLGSGVDCIYPRRHKDLYRAIIDSGGVVISEFPPGTPPKGEHFPQRNRIISGLSLGVLVVEAALRSGSLITARQAMEQGREVFAMPGSVHSPRSRGCHQLIREGATLTETAADIVGQLGGLLALKAGEADAGTGDAPSLPPSCRQLLEIMGFDPMDMDTLASVTGLETGELTSRLVTLELEGLVENRGGRFSRIR